MRQRMHRDQKTGSIVGHFVYFLKPVVPEISHILPRSGGLAKSLSHCMASETLSHQRAAFYQWPWSMSVIINIHDEWVLWLCVESSHLGLSCVSARTTDMGWKVILTTGAQALGVWASLIFRVFLEIYEALHLVFRLMWWLSETIPKPRTSKNKSCALAQRKASFCCPQIIRTTGHLGSLDPQGPVLVRWHSAGLYLGQSSRLWIQVGLSTDSRTSLSSGLRGQCTILPVFKVGLCRNKVRKK